LKDNFSMCVLLSDDSIHRFKRRPSDKGGSPEGAEETIQPRGAVPKLSAARAFHIFTSSISARFDPIFTSTWMLNPSGAEIESTNKGL
jgi:hypothetical protein